MGGSNTLKALVGKKTNAEKDAENAQKAALAQAKTEADAALAERQKRMEKKKQGRGSLLTGSEMGVEGTSPATTSTLG
jgi:hypothetical protein